MKMEMNSKMSSPDSNRELTFQLTTVDGKTLAYIYPAVIDPEGCYHRAKVFLAEDLLLILTVFCLKTVP